MSENAETPNLNETLAIYDQIEKTAKTTLLSGNAVGNTLISPDYKDPRHFVSVDLYLPDSPVRNFLSKIIADVSASEKGFVGNEKEHLHVSGPEIWESPEGRRRAGVGAEDVQEYYRTLRDNLADQKTVRLLLERITLTADAPIDGGQPEKRSIALIALFTSVDNEAFELKKKIQETIAASKLKSSPPRHPGKVLYASLGRFASPPALVESNYPIIEAVQKFNTQIPSRAEIELTKMEMITTGIKTILSTGHVFLSPPIEFQKEKRSGAKPTFIRPKSRPQ